MMNELVITDNSTTEANGYRITPAEERLLEVLLNPENLGKSVTEKCRIAGINRTTYYDVMKKPQFLEALNKTSIDLVRDKLADVLAASVKVAINSGARGFNDRKMLLEMFGVVVKENDNKIVIVNIKE